MKPVTHIDTGNKKIKILVVSSIVPDAKDFSGPLVLHRYLNEHPLIETEVFQWKTFPFRLKIIGKLRQLGLVGLSRFLECLWPVLPSLSEIKKHVDTFQPHVLLTVAHRFMHIQAVHAARKFDLPLVTFFQDWWPEFPDVPRCFRKRVERQIFRTRDHSNLCICVSEGMQLMLGKPASSILIHDMPSRIQSPDWRMGKGGIWKVVYFGNLAEYGPPLEQALSTLEGSNLVRLEIYGAKPNWSQGMEEKFRKSGNYLGKIPSSEVARMLPNYHATLVCMSFEPSMRDRMATSFPSKLIEAAQVGLPIIVWGPEYCSAVRWARHGNRALCVTESNPAALCRALTGLAGSPVQQRHFADAARGAADLEFNPDRIRQQFLEALNRLTGAVDWSQSSPETAAKLTSVA